MISTDDSRAKTGNLQSKHEENAFFRQLLPFVCNNSTATSQNMPIKSSLNSAMGEKCTPVSWFHASCGKAKSLPGARLPNFFLEEDECSRTPVSEYSAEAISMEHGDAIVAACHLLLLSKSFHERESMWGSHVERLAMQEKYEKSPGDSFAEDSDSFGPASVTSGFLSSYECRSTGSGVSHNGNRTESSSMMTESEVTSVSNAGAKKRRKTNYKIHADLCGQGRECDVLERPAPKRRYRSLSELTR